jgi:hypothetical protein
MKAKPDAICKKIIFRINRLHNDKQWKKCFVESFLRLLDGFSQSINFFDFNFQEEKKLSSDSSQLKPTMRCQTKGFLLRSPNAP